MQDYLTIRNFTHEDPFSELVELLQEYDIPHKTEIYKARLDPISMITLSPEFIVKVPSNRFGQIDQILQEIAASEVHFADSDHYLFAFRDEELFDILASPDEWSAFDYQLTRKILSDRNLGVDAALLDSLNKSRLRELAEPRNHQTFTILIGYTLALSGGLFGLFWGWNMATARKILPNGRRVYVFGLGDRRHGWGISGLSILVILSLAFCIKAGSFVFFK